LTGRPRAHAEREPAAVTPGPFGIIIGFLNGPWRLPPAHDTFREPTPFEQQIREFDRPGDQAGMPWGQRRRLASSFIVTSRTAGQAVT
jgi:hypothetical protein